MNKKYECKKEIAAVQTTAERKQTPHAAETKADIGVKRTALEWFMPMIPPTVTAQEQKIGIVKYGVNKGKPYKYDTPEIKAAKAKLLSHLEQYAPEEAFTGAVRLTTKWLFPCGKDHKDGEYKTTKPDTDNSIKMLKDCMTMLHFWKDDALVVSEITEKFWAEIPGIYVRVEEIL